MKRKLLYKLILEAFGVFFLVSSAVSWSNIKRLTWNSGQSMSVDCAVDNTGGLYCVWNDNTPGNCEIFFKTSSDQGQTWTGLKRLTWTNDDCLEPKLALDSSSNLHVVWFKYQGGFPESEIYYKKSTDGGTTWSGPTRLTWVSGWSAFPVIALDSLDRLHVFWMDNVNGQTEIYYKKSLSAGISWSASQRLTWNSGASVSVTAAVDPNDNIHIVWSDSTPGNRELYYKKSVDNGGTWSHVKRLTWMAEDSEGPDINVDSNGNPYVVWCDYISGMGKVYFKRSTDGGATWTGARRIVWTAGYSTTPNININSNDIIQIVWSDNTTGYPNYEIYYKVSDNYGSSWHSQFRLTWNSGASKKPVLVTETPSDSMHVFWHDDTYGNNEIFYKNQIF